MLVDVLVVALHDSRGACDLQAFDKVQHSGHTIDGLFCTMLDRTPRVEMVDARMVGVEGWLSFGVCGCGADKLADEPREPIRSLNHPNVFLKVRVHLSIGEQKAGNSLIHSKLSLYPNLSTHLFAATTHYHPRS